MTQSAYFLQEDSLDPDRDKIIAAALESQDSLKLQFENKVEDLYIVAETPPKKLKLSPKEKSPKQIPIKNDIFNELFTQTPAKATEDKNLNKNLIEPKLEPMSSTKPKKFTNRIVDLFEEDDQDILPKDKDPKTSKSQDKTSQVVTKNNKLKETKFNPNIQKTSQIKNEQKSFLSTLNRSNVIYSKSNPPKESIKSDIKIVFILNY